LKGFVSFTGGGGCTASLFCKFPQREQSKPPAHIALLAIEDISTNIITVIPEKEIWQHQEKGCDL
jgi:hypothetical protein